MELLNIPFRKLGPDDIARPWLPVTAINPYNNKKMKIFGLIDFMPNLYVPLLGVKSFLSNFILTIDYPRQIFSLRK